MAKARRKPKPQANEPGFDGAKVIQLDVRVSRDRKVSRSMRARPGTFEWRYGRETGDGALYHAGIHYADLWEKAGAASAKSVDLGATTYTEWRGLPDGRVIALDELKVTVREIGKLTSRRLSLYCVEGETASEIATRFGVSARDMAVVLHQDLRTVALHFRYV